MRTDSYDENYKILNKEQKKAVDTIYGPVMVVAGPGTGKTQIIGLRTASIIENARVNPENILITTFTEAGVIAIRKRLIKFIGEEAYKVNVSTIHSFSLEVIKSFPEKFIEYKTSQAIDEIDSLEVFKEIIDKLATSKKLKELVSDYDRFFYLRDIKARISNLKQEGISAEQFVLLIKNEEKKYAEELSEIKKTLKKYETTRLKNEKHISKLNELVLLYIEYNKTLRDSGKYDFNDMINFVLEKFRSDKDLLYHYAERFQFIMLDEYQDTNNAQNEIMNLLLSVDTGEGDDSSSKANIMVVGDDDQSIYRFQGANIENMLDFSVHFKDTEFVVLKNNYRSNQSILDASSKLIENNDERLSNKIESIDKKLISSNKSLGEDLTPKLYRALNDIDERVYVLGNIQNIINSSKTPLNEIAIIVRSNREVIEWTNILRDNGIETESKLKTNIFDSIYVKFLIKYLRIISDSYSSENDLIDIMRSSVMGLSQVDVLKINRYLYNNNYTKKHKIKMMDFLSDEKDLIELSLPSESDILEFRNNILELSSKTSETNIVLFFNILIEKLDLLKSIDEKGSLNDLEDVYTLFNKIKNWAVQDKEFDLEKLIQRLDLYRNYNMSIERQVLKKAKKGVQIMTAHSSKGLEFDIVFIPGLYNSNWEGKIVRDKLRLPTGLAGDGLQYLDEKEKKFREKDKQLEEDRRLLFVAMTRSRKSLFISYPSGIGTKPLLASSFIEEMDGCYDIHENNYDSNSMITEIVHNELKHNTIEYSEEEFLYIEQFLENYKLSASDLNIFLKDPIDFLNKVVFKYPFLDNEFTIFGKVYHRTLELFFLKNKGEGKLPEKSYILSTFKLLLQKELLTEEEFERLLEKGEKGLEGLYDQKLVNSKDVAFLELKFRQRNVMYEGIPLTGMIDKVEFSGSCENGIDKKDEIMIGQSSLFRYIVNLVDYKTGRIKSLSEIKGVDRYGNKKEGAGQYFRQLLFYKLLFERDRELRDSYDLGSLLLDFVEGKDGKYKTVELEFTEDDYKDFLEELKEVWGKINDLEFWKEILK